jgi:hypothetical protein
MSTFNQQDKELYHDILEGLSIYFDSALIVDILNTINKLPRADFGNAFNRNQLSSKKWLIDQLTDVTDGNFDNIVILGGWYGVLSALLFNDARFSIRSIASVDINPDCAGVAECLNQRFTENGTFRALTGDMFELDYISLLPAPNRSPTANLLINTSCEHIADFSRWYQQVPTGTTVTLQSNNFFECDEHINCVNDVSEFQQLAPMSKTLFAGELPLKKYTRFMLIGVK